MTDKKRGRGRPKMAPEKKRVSVHYTVSPDTDAFVREQAGILKTSESSVVDTYISKHFPKKRKLKEEKK